MSVSRRGFFGLVGSDGRASGLAALIAARGHEEVMAQAQGAAQTGRAAGPGPAGGTQGRGGGTGGRGGAAGQAGGRGGRPAPPPGIDEIKISSNENPLGPGKHVLDAITGKFPEAGRYPFNSTPNDTKLVEAIAAAHKAKPENVVLGAGSQEVLKTSMLAFTSPFRHLVTASPTFENCTGIARRLGFGLREVKVDSQLRLDLEGMLTVARGAGLIFVNNPNNPTATVHGAKAITDFVERVRRISPDTVILIDEAYHEYVTDPEYSTAIPLALATPNVFVARTFSKAYGMAGMRIGYAIGQPDTIKPLARLKMPYNISVFGIAAGPRGARQPAARRRRADAQHRSADVYHQVLRRDGLQGGGVAGQLPVRRHRPSGGGVPGGVRRPMGGRRPRLPALRTQPRANLPRHHGGDEARH